VKRARRTHDLGRGRPRPLRYGATGLGAALVAGFLAGSSVFPAQPPAAEPPNAPAALADQALAAYNASDYPAAERLASRYIEAARLGGITGRKLAEIQFVLGHSRYEIQHRSQAPYPGDYRADVVSPLEESFRILQDNPAFRTLLLGNAYFELWTAGGRHDADAEAQAHWYFLKSILIRESETPLLTRDALEGTADRLLAPFFDERENPKGRRIRLIGVRVEKLARDTGTDAGRTLLGPDEGR